MRTTFEKAIEQLIKKILNEWETTFNSVVKTGEQKGNFEIQLFFSQGEEEIGRSKIFKLNLCSREKNL